MKKSNQIRGVVRLDVLDERIRGQYFQEFVRFLCSRVFPSRSTVSLAIGFG